MFFFSKQLCLFLFFLYLNFIQQTFDGFNTFTPFLLMSKRPSLNVKLISCGAIIPRLHYGVDICKWWTTRGEKDLEDGVYLYPIRVGWQTVLEINNKYFYTQVLEGNEKHENQPGYRCQVGLKLSDIEEASSPAITSLYKRVCQNNSTKFSGPQVLGWDDSNILEQSLTGIEFRPFLIKFDKYIIYITALGEVNKAGAGIGYTAMFASEHLGKYAKYVQRIDVDGCHIDIYQDGILEQHFIGATPNEVWTISKKLKKFRGTQLFGLEHPLTNQVLSKQQIPKCDETFWHNKDIMNHIYNHYLRRQTISKIQWHEFFINWKNDPCTIIEFYSSITALYPSQYTFKDRELRAWKAMLKAVGCHEITPFTKDESKVNKIN